MSEVELRATSFVASAGSVSGLPAPVFTEVAFAGKSNVGKSSLINTLLGRRHLARVSNTPGRTRTLNLLRAVLPEGTLDLVDLPGYGYAKVSKSERRSWGPMIEGFLESRAGLRGVVLIVDVRRGLGEDDTQLLEHLRGRGLPALLVATKVDKLAKSARMLALQSLAKQSKLRPIAFSSETREGREALWRAILETGGLIVKPP
jgi:GTP-binding protein